MKRSNSAPCLFDKDLQPKKIKTTNEQTGPTSREYLQLALAKVMELQRAVKDDTYFAENSRDPGVNGDEDIMREVLTKVFKDLPGSSASVPSLIERAIYRPPELTRVREKSIQLSGYDTCRKVALDFMKTTIRHSPEPPGHNGYMKKIGKTRRRETLSTEYEIKSRMLRGLDLHLAIKQRDYTYKLMKL